MKLSELQQAIEEIITEILSENANLVTEVEDEDDDSTSEKEPSKTDVKKSEKGLSFTPEEKKTKFNQFLASVKKNKGDKAKIDGILKLAKDKFKFTKDMLDDLKRTAGRNVE